MKNLLNIVVSSFRKKEGVIKVLSKHMEPWDAYELTRQTPFNAGEMTRTKANNLKEELELHGAVVHIVSS